MVEKWKKSVDNVKVFGALLTDLSKVFDSFDHEMFITKLKVYVFSLPALKLILDFLSKAKQQTKIDSSYNN